MQRARIGAALILFSLGTAAPAAAHSWYPYECCSSLDCMPADDVRRDALGDIFVRVGSREIRLPRDFAIRPSQDSRAHICFRDEAPSRKTTLLCLFLPAEG